MGKRIKDSRERVIQKSVGFRFRQIEFLNKFPEFRPDEYCRDALDEQIKLIDVEFLPKKENEM